MLAAMCEWTHPRRLLREQHCQNSRKNEKESLRSVGARAIARHAKLATVLVRGKSGVVMFDVDE